LGAESGITLYLLRRLPRIRIYRLHRTVRK